MAGEEYANLDLRIRREGDKYVASVDDLGCRSEFTQPFTPKQLDTFLGRRAAEEILEVTLGKQTKSSLSEDSLKGFGQKLSGLSLRSQVT